MKYSNCGSKKNKNIFDFMDDAFAGDVKDFTQKFKQFGEEMRQAVHREFAENYPLSNILENDQEYRIEVAAPGLNKEDFKLELVEGFLHISTQETAEEPNVEDSNEDHEEAKEKFRKREFDFRTFKRRFKIPPHVNLQAIQAKYEQGILKVHLPKLLANDTQSQGIKVE